jgi:hypothetical protein
MLTFWPVALGETPTSGAGLWLAEADGRWAEVAWGEAAFAATAGVVRGGAVGVARAGSARTGAASFSAGAGAAGLAASSADRGGASRSSSRAAGGAAAGLRPGVLAFRERRLILGFSDAFLSKLNSIGSALGSDWAAGLGVSGMTHLQITPRNGNSKT